MHAASHVRSSIFLAAVLACDGGRAVEPATVVAAPSPSPRAPVDAPAADAAPVASAYVAEIAHPRVPGFVVRTADVQACYDAALAEHSRLTGQLELEFDHHPDGTISDLTVVTSTVASPRLETCVVESMRAAHTTRPHRTRTVKMRSLIVFRKQ